MLRFEKLLSCHYYTRGHVEVLCNKTILKNIAKIKGKHLKRLHHRNSYVKQLHHRCFSEVFENFFRVPILLNNTRLLSLLNLVPTAAISLIAHLRRRRERWFELSKVRLPTLIAGDEYGDEYQKDLIFIAQVHRPTTCRKRCKD